ARAGRARPPGLTAVGLGNSVKNREVTRARTDALFPRARRSRTTLSLGIDASVRDGAAGCHGNPREADQGSRAQARGVADRKVRAEALSRNGEQGNQTVPPALLPHRRV